MNLKTDFFTAKRILMHRKHACALDLSAEMDDSNLRRAGEVPVTYETPELKPILKETYGLILYHEQFMQVVHVISGLSLGKADHMQRSMGLRKTKEQCMWHEVFLAEGRKRGYGEDFLNNMWNKLRCFAPYSFLKAHAVARVLLLYRVVYIKAVLHSDTNSN